MAIYDALNRWAPVLIVVVALTASWGLQRALLSLLRRSPTSTGALLASHVRTPIRLILPLLAVVLALPFLRMSPEVLKPCAHILGLALIAGTAWLLIGLLQTLHAAVDERYRADEKLDVQARIAVTRVQLLRHVGVALVLISTVTGMLMTFSSVRHFGMSLFASAGIAGVIAGIAARPALSNLIAGIQVGLNGVIRVDDIVVVEGQWGQIEEIASTYAVVRIWDERRLVLPLTYFLEKPFENWNRKHTRILGTVFIFVDYEVPVEPVRRALKGILESTPLWDGRVWGLQVTDATERGVQLRALMSAADSDDIWDLRCIVREGLVGFLRNHYPGGLPRTRTEIVGRPAEPNRALASIASR